MAHLGLSHCVRDHLDGHGIVSAEDDSGDEESKENRLSEDRGRVYWSR